MKSWKFTNNDKMPLIGLGTWKSKTNEVYEAVRSAIKIGYRHIDCAHIYMNEGEIGTAIRDAIDEGDVKRNELWITSKLWNNCHGKGDVKPALEHTLSNLGLEYLDLYLIHWPVAHKSDVVFAQDGSGFLSLDEMPIIETWNAMEACVNDGLTRHIGVSNFSITKLKDLLSKCQIKPEVNQIELHPLLQQTEMLKFCRDHEILLTAYSPLGSRDRIPEMKAANEPDLFENPVIKSIAAKHSCTPAQAIIAWSVNRTTSVIPKSTNPDRLKQNFVAADIKLDDADMKKINALDKHFRFVNGKFFEMEGSPYTVRALWDE